MLAVAIRRDGHLEGHLTKSGFDVFKTLSRAVDALSIAIAYLSGASFLVLSFYITYDSLARDFGLPFSGISDEMSSYVLAVSGTWAMAYGLRIGAHVRIDLVVSHLGPRARRLLDGVATGITGAFAILLAVFAWRQALESHALGTRSITPLRALLEIPQALVAVGFTLLAMQAVLMLIAGVAASTTDHRM